MEVLILSYGDRISATTAEHIMSLCDEVGVKYQYIKDPLQASIENRRCDIAIVVATDQGVETSQIKKMLRYMVEKPVAFVCLDYFDISFDPYKDFGSTILCTTRGEIRTLIEDSLDSGEIDTSRLPDYFEHETRMMRGVEP